MTLAIWMGVNYLLAEESRRRHPATSATERAGVTIIEMLTIVTVIGILASILAPGFHTIRTHAAVNEATSLVAADLNQALSLAARRQRPMVLASAGTASYTVRDRATSPDDSIRLSRNLGSAADLHVSTVNFSPSSVVVFPNGTTSQALTVTVGTVGYTRTVTMSPAGLIRVLQP